MFNYVDRTRSGGPWNARTGAKRRRLNLRAQDWARKNKDIHFGCPYFSKRETGIEPATPSLARRCSTAEPLAHVYVRCLTDK